jgi:hypothetical protein
MTTAIKKVQTHIRQRLMVKLLHYYADGRNTDPTTTYNGRMGMPKRQAERLKETTRELILIAADNIRAGKE